MTHLDGFVGESSRGFPRLLLRRQQWAGSMAITGTLGASAGWRFTALPHDTAHQQKWLSMAAPARYKHRTCSINFQLAPVFVAARLSRGLSGDGRSGRQTFTATPPVGERARQFRGANVGERGFYFGGEPTSPPLFRSRRHPVVAWYSHELQSLNASFASIGRSRRSTYSFWMSAALLFEVAFQ